MNPNDPIRQALLDAAEEDFRQALAHAPDAPGFSVRYQAWEEKFLRDPTGFSKRTLRPVWKTVLRWAACFLFVVSLSFGAGIFAGPQVWATVSGWFDSSPAPTATGLEVSIQLDGPHGCVYTSEKFACVAENGSTLRYWYQNNGTSTCTLQLYRIGFFGGEAVGDSIPIEPGDDAVGIYENPGNDTFYLRVTCVDGYGAYINGTLRADQYN